MPDSPNAIAVAGSDPDTEAGACDSIEPTSLNRERALVVVQCPDAALVGRRFPLRNSQSVIVGRGSEAHLAVKDPRLSKQHFLIVAKRDELVCGDLGSTNRTRVDGAEIRSCALTHGSVIRAGDTIFVAVTDNTQCDAESLARRCALTCFPVLLQGETGTGKEVMARKLHVQSGRSGPFIAVNCATFSRDLIAAELFGHTKGAFSGASSARSGLFRAADGGTLFLDEIGDMPHELQSSLLRVLEESKVRPVGSDQEIAIDVRVICATHVDLSAASADRQFRVDLYARLAHIVVKLPALRERREDIMSLAQQFCGGANFSPNAAEALVRWHWPRNVRELKGLVEVVSALSRKRGIIRLSDLTGQVPELGESVRQGQRPGTAPPEAAKLHPMFSRRDELLALFQDCSGNVSQIAQRLGKPRMQVYRWVKALGIDAAQFRK